MKALENRAKTRIQYMPTPASLTTAILIVFALCACFLTSPVGRTAHAAEPDDEAPGEFLFELLRVESEEGGYLRNPVKTENGQRFEGPYTYFGYARLYAEPLLCLPGVDTVMTNSGYVFLWDDGSGHLRLKELWYDEADCEALVVRWSPGISDPDPAYGEGGLRYPEYSWSRTAVETNLNVDGTLVNLRYYAAEPSPVGHGDLFADLYFAPAESLLSSFQRQDVRMARVCDFELGAYEAVSEEDFAARWGAPLLTPPELPEHFEPTENLYVLGAELGSPRFARLWLSPESGEALFASWRFSPGGAERPLSMGYERPDALLGWVGFFAESRGKVGDMDVVLRYYAADSETDPEYVRSFLENATLTNP